MILPQESLKYFSPCVILKLKNDNLNMKRFWDIHGPTKKGMILYFYFQFLSTFV